MATIVQAINLTTDSEQTITLPVSYNIVTVLNGRLLVETNTDSISTVDIVLRLLQAGDEIAEPMRFVGQLYSDRDILVYQVTA